MGGIRVRAEKADQIDERFADNLMAMRNRRRMSRRTLAELTGIPIYTLDSIETGHGCRAGVRRRVSIGEAVLLAEALGVKPGELLKDVAE